MPHQLCHFHYLREAATPVYEADRHAKVQLKKKVRGIRPIERKVEGREDAEARDDPGLLRGGALALTDDGRPPLEASGLKLVVGSPGWPRASDRVAGKKRLCSESRPEGPSDREIARLILIAPSPAPAPRGGRCG